MGGVFLHKSSMLEAGQCCQSFLEDEQAETSALGEELA